MSDCPSARGPGHWWRIFAPLGNLPRGLSLMRVASPRGSLAWAGLVVVEGLLPAAAVLITREIVNSVVSSAGEGGGWDTVRPVLLPVAAMGGLLVLAELVRSVGRWVRTALGEALRNHLSERIQCHAASLDLEFYDSPEYFDQLHRARSEALHRPQAFIDSIGSLSQAGITLLLLSVVILPYGAWLPLLLLLGAVPSVVLLLRNYLAQHRFRHETTQDERRSQYLDWLLTGREAAADLRVLAIGSHLLRAAVRLRERLSRGRVRLALAQSLSQLVAMVLAMAVSGAAVAWLGWRTLAGELTLGDLALFVQALYSGQRLLASLKDNLGGVYSNALFLGDLFRFLDLRSRMLAPASPARLPERPTIGYRLTAVEYRYPGSPRPALADLDLEIPAGQIIAIVGENGSGKSTLLRLLARLIDPSCGRVELDGVDLRQCAPEALRARISMVLQRPLRYHGTVAENIALGDLGRGDDRPSIEAAAGRAGVVLDPERMPDGIETPLGPRFVGGTDLSAGEWQRIALARAYLRRAPILLLDEPTASMDTWAEARWLPEFLELCRGRTVVLVTHRLATAMHADRIHVLERGRVVESGRHDELVAEGGRYAASWSARGRRVSTQPRAPRRVTRIQPGLDPG